VASAIIATLIGMWQGESPKHISLAWCHIYHAFVTSLWRQFVQW